MLLLPLFRSVRVPVAIALVFATTARAEATVWEPMVSPELPEFEVPSPFQTAQAESNGELVEAMRNLQGVLEERLTTSQSDTTQLSSASDRLLGLLNSLLESPPSESPPELLAESQTLQQTITRQLQREDANLNPELQQKLVLTRRLLGALLGDNRFNLGSDVIENSPVLQRWNEEIPDVLAEIRNDPAFRTRVRLGYAHFPSTDHKGGFNAGVEDIFLGRTGLTLSGNYERVFSGDRETFGADLNYYVLPLGSYVNIAPVLGYRNITTGSYNTDGIAVGGKVIFPLSRTGAADLTFSQLFVSPGSADEVGITTLSVGYAITRHLRLSTDIQKQNSIGEKDSRVGIILEWMP
ncbi:MAG: hypothetical protein SW833_11970 [Cyanobacteriota bacterium]|nr:hypothetical protein [Cyanobacteriota bacterium]